MNLKNNEYMINPGIYFPGFLFFAKKIDRQKNSFCRKIN